MFHVSSTGGDFDRTRAFFDRILSRSIYDELDRYGRMGVDALSRATPVRSGLTASSWGYKVIKGKKPTVLWFNTNNQNGSVPVAILIQYGHGTGTGGYVEGIDYINPAIRPIFEQIADEVWKKVKA